MTISWSEPLDNGGCPITGYAIFRDDGVTQLPTIEVNANNDPLVRDIPTLREVTAVLNNADLGKNFKFEVRAYNREGYAAAQSGCFPFAVAPPQPASGPTVV